MHRAKGLEFRAFAVMACDDEVVPLQGRVEAVADSADLEEVYNTERHLLYVACTRARDALLVTGLDPASEFLDDRGGEGETIPGPSARRAVIMRHASTASRHCRLRPRSVGWCPLAGATGGRVGFGSGNGLHAWRGLGSVSECAVAVQGHQTASTSR